MKAEDIGTFDVTPTWERPPSWVDPRLDPKPDIVAGAISPCCNVAVLRDPVGFHCRHCGIPLHERSPYAD